MALLGPVGPAWMFLILLALNVVRWLLKRSRVRWVGLLRAVGIGVLVFDARLRLQTGFIHQHKIRLVMEIATLRKQAEAYNNPSTYVKCAKFQRLANAKEKELASLQEAQQPALQDSLDQMITIIKVIFVVVAIITTWGKPLVTVPADWTWPFGRLLAFPHSSTYLEVGAITVIPWVTLCDRVSQAVACAAFPQHYLDLRTKPLQPVAEE